MAGTLPIPPIEPPPSRLVFPDPRTISGDIVAVSSDFTAGSMLAAFRRGIFPWPRPDDGGVIGWYSPNPRAVLPLDTPPRWQTRLRQRLRSHPYEVTTDTAFADVIHACADRSEGTWLFPAIVAAYTHLHELGWAHSVEVWDRSSGTRELVGGAFGVAFGAVFSADSMYHRRTDCGKIAFMTLAERLHAGGFVAIDLQIRTPDLARLGCIEISRNAYLDLVARAQRVPARL